MTTWPAPSTGRRPPTGTARVASYLWDFGDGGTSTSATPAHTYSAAGAFTVTLTVKDDKGATGTVSHTATATAPPVNQNPAAAFTSSCTDATCVFDGSGSADPDGTVATYAWDFGDGATGTGSTPSHTYATTGSYTVSLQVTDNAGGTGSVTHVVTATVPTPVVPVGFVGAAHSTPGSAKFKAAAIPAQTKAGDKLLLFLTTPSTVTWTGPTGVTGWTQVDSFVNGTVKSTLWQKTATSDDLGKTVRVDDPTGYRLGVLSVVAYTGVDPAAQLVAARQGDSATSSHVSPMLTVPAGSWVATYWSDKSSGTTQWTAPSGVAVRDTLTADPGATRFSALLVDSDGVVPAGSYGGLRATTNATSDKAVSWAVALTPKS